MTNTTEVRFRTVGRKPLPALSIKVYSGPTVEQIAEAARDADVPDEYRAGFTLDYLDRVERDARGAYSGFARDHTLEQIEQDARSIFGRHVKVYTDGRSGGWLVVDGLPDHVLSQVEANPWEAPYTPDTTGTDQDDATGWRCGDLELAADASILERWRFFAATVAEYVRDFPRAVAEEVARSVYVPAGEKREAAMIERVNAEKLAQEVRAEVTGRDEARDLVLLAAADWIDAHLPELPKE